MLKIKINIEKLVKSITNLKVESTRKMEGMVRKFTYQVAYVSTSNTPLGNAEYYQKLYDLRQIWPKEEGMARANWQFSRDRSFPDIIDSGRDTGSRAVTNIQTQMKSYKLGDNFYIGNGLSYVVSQLERNNKSPQTMGQGIMKPSIDAIVNVYGIQLNEYYKTS